MGMPMSAPRRWWRAAAAPVLVAALPALVLVASSGAPGTASGPAPGPGSGSGPARAGATTVTPMELATAFVRRRQVVAPGLARAVAPVSTRSYSGSIDTRSRATVNSAYWSMFEDGLDLPIGWTGSNSGCVRGSTSSQSRSATLSSINFVRRLAGLAPVRFSSTLNAHAQAAALIMSANGQLNHFPPSTWRCYTKTGAQTASRSNLALSQPSITSGGIVAMYMDDPGAANYGVGHRRWVLNPFATTMGSGSTSTTNALQVVGPTSRKRPNPAYVGWPTKGWFPNALEPNGRWSLSAGNKRTNFRYASIHVYRGTTSIKVHKYRVENGYAQPTLVWQMPDNLSPTGSYRVVVKGIRHRGSAKRFQTSYTVKLFTPTR